MFSSVTALKHSALYFGSAFVYLISSALGRQTLCLACLSIYHSNRYSTLHTLVLQSVLLTWISILRGKD